MEVLCKIIKEISQVKFLNNIVIGLDKETKNFYKQKNFFLSLQKHEILWNDGPNLKGLDSDTKQNLAPQK